MNEHLFVFRPGGIQWLNVFTDWALLISAMSCVQGRKILEFDDSLSPTASCQIPVGNWPMKDVMWAGFGPRRGRSRTIVAILSGAEFTDLRMIGGQITIVNQATGSGVLSPVRDFSDHDHVQIGLRDDCGNAHLVNQGDVPMFDLGVNSALFFLQNCLFGMPTTALEGVPHDLRVPNPLPLIRHRGSSVLTLNLLGQNQTGPKVVSSETGASVLFGALSSAAQVAFDQTSITSAGGTYSFGPQGRIQRLVIPRPPDYAPAKTSQTIPTPNVLIRCDGNPPGFTQDLPRIADGFKIGGSSTVDLYTGGQEVVVAEVSGGLYLSVRPAPGDTIDGGGTVPIGSHGSRTFVSDGVSNWITISEVP